jgi:uncharacterized membrane protein SpoIIM required for sporulation
VPALGISTRWIERRRPHWDRLDTLVGACDRRGIRALGRAELRELALLYRQTAADLSIVRDDVASRELARYLNTLLGRAHNLVYAGGTAPRRGVVHFYARIFPGVFRATLGYTLAAFALFAAGLVAGAAMTWADPAFARLVLPAPMLDTIERGEMWTHSILGVKPLASSAITTNNLSVSFAAFAGGMLFGLGTAYMMVLNGVLIGVIAVTCHRAGMSLPLWSFVAPHGSLELPAIFIAGGAGLLLGRGLLVPGFLSRRDSLVDAAATGVRLVLGVIPLLIVAGAIEGFLSPTDVPPSMKFAVSASLFVLLAAYVAIPSATNSSQKTPAP